MWRLKYIENEPCAAYVVGGRVISYIRPKYLVDTPRLADVYSQVMDELNKESF
jgi:hypothetical protein